MSVGEIPTRRRTAHPPQGLDWAVGSLLHELAQSGPGGVEARLALERCGTARVYARGETMLFAHARDTFVLLMLDGFAKVTLTDASGAPVLIDVRAAGDVVGETAAFDGGPRSATVTAAQSLHARRISQEEWLQWATGNPAAARAVMRNQTHRGRTASRRRQDFVSGPVIARMARAALDLAEQYGTRERDGLRVRPGLTQAEWGGFIGAKERRVHHALHELADAGVITFGRCRLVIRSVPRLREYAAIGGEE
ncbi:Crp/Fnr family transcriptional regulator [Streptomyces sp. NPDC059155]|uniref:Crp/Fnr family transcriptional regulator n=1 Tax=unclassified Streptomyces TaxID=2593676 RepID=UPI0036C4B53C